MTQCWLRQFAHPPDTRLGRSVYEIHLGQLARLSDRSQVCIVTGVHGACYLAVMRKAFAAVGTATRFGLFARHFYSRFVFKCLNYFVSKTAPDHTGAGRRFATVDAMSKFADALNTHCHEASRVVEEFAGDWMSKRNHLTEGQIGREETAGFVAHCMTKLTAELRKRTETDGR